MASNLARKVLRIGLIQNGRIVEEKLLYRRETVTIGHSEKCTFVLPVKGLPKSYELFICKKGEFTLNFHSKMQGKVSVGSQVLDFQALQSDPRTREKGGFQQFPIDEESRGKIIIGDVTLLFQFIPPPPPSQFQLPAHMKRSMWQMMDWPFTLTFLVSLILQSGSLSYLVTREYEEEVKTLVDLDPRFIELIEPEVKEPEPEPEPEPDDTEDSEASSESSAPSRDRAAEPPPPDAPRERVQKTRVVNSTVLSALVGVATDGPGDFINSVTSSSAESDMKSAFEGAEMVATRSSKVARRRDRGPEERAVSTGRESTGGRTRRRPKRERGGTVRLSRAPIKPIGGTLNPAKIRAVIRRKVRTLNSCYQNELKRNGSLQGKITLLITIGASGSRGKVVGTPRVVGNTMTPKGAGSKVGSCVARKVRTWRFPKPAGGNAILRYPFIFTPSN
ncbi:MAG: AgmX/PglI C-terminal domain-containing protein [Myxococcota bacterium]|nr:AgmX/PglI C-terminal domain-containing protein [Myxococcota bacterium]